MMLLSPPRSPHRGNFHLINFKGSNFASHIFGLMLITNVVCEMERNFGMGKLNPPAASGPPGLPLSHMKLQAQVIIFPTFPISARVPPLDKSDAAALKVTAAH